MRQAVWPDINEISPQVKAGCRRGLRRGPFLPQGCIHLGKGRIRVEPRHSHPETVEPNAFRLSFLQQMITDALAVTPNGPSYGPVTQPGKIDDAVAIFPKRSPDIRRQHGRV